MAAALRATAARGLWGVAAVAGVLGALAFFALLALLDWYIRYTRGIGLARALMLCPGRMANETMGILTVHANAVQGAPAFELPRWAPWRPSPRRYVGGGRFV